MRAVIKRVTTTTTTTGVSDMTDKLLTRCANSGSKVDIEDESLGTAWEHHFDDTAIERLKTTADTCAFFLREVPALTAHQPDTLQQLMAETHAELVTIAGQLPSNTARMLQSGDYDEVTITVYRAAKEAPTEVKMHTNNGGAAHPDLPTPIATAPEHEAAQNPDFFAKLDGRPTT